MVTVIVEENKHGAVINPEQELDEIRHRPQAGRQFDTERNKGQVQAWNGRC
jgi:hypothetical protein